MNIEMPKHESIPVTLDIEKVEKHQSDFSDLETLHEGGSMEDRSVLVIPTPENCIRCQLMHRGANGGDYCFNEKYVSDFSETTDPECPLRKLPQKEICNEYDFQDFKNGRAMGWNRCIEQITGEKVDYSIRKQDQ